MKLPTSWMPIVGAELDKPYFRQLQQFLAVERAAGEVYPPDDRVFAALELTPPEAVRVVLLGQDPYHDAGQAHGLAFSVQPGMKLPASLRNIFKELNDDLGVPSPKHGCLVSWAQQGVLLLNAVPTVRAHEAHSHRRKGWESFTDAIISKLSERAEPMILVLWGNPAQAKKKLIDTDRHVVLESSHPSPLSAHCGFFGCKVFSTINRTLRKWGQTEIEWAIQDGSPTR